MKKSIKNSKKNFLALCLSVLMVTSGAVAMASCSSETSTDSSSTDSSSSTTTDTSTSVNDTQLIKNGGFETFDTKDGLNAIGTSVTGWTRSVNSVTSGSALTSKAASGIINTDETVWNDLVGVYDGSISGLSEEKAKEIWDTLSVRDKLAYYEAWNNANKDGTIADDLDFYQAFNIKEIDIPDCENPGTHYTEDDEGYGEDTNVLMIHNKYPEKDSTTGTAQKYSSSSTVTIPAGTAAELSVWVKTSDLMSGDTNGNSQKAVGKGAYITVSQSVGSKSLPVFEVKNINTEYMDEAVLSNGWMQYTFYLKGSSYANTTFSIVLGLGQGGGTDRLDYVNGYAFFDDIQCNLTTQEAYDDNEQDANLVVDFDAEKSDKTVDISDPKTSDYNCFAMNYCGEFEELAILDTIGNDDVAPTTGEDKDGNSFTAEDLDDKLTTDDDVAGVFTGTEGIRTADTDNPYLNAIYKKYFENSKFIDDDQDILFIMSTQGVAYTAEPAFEFNFNMLRQPTDEPADYLAISFFVKTSDLNGFTGAGVTLKDGNNKTSFTSIDTTDISKVDLDEENKDIFDGWQQCFFFVENGYDIKKDATFTLSFTYGPTSLSQEMTASSFYEGFAAFTGFQIYEMSQSEYDSISTGTYAKAVKVEGVKAQEAAGNSGFDSASNVPTNAIEKGLANPTSYKGVYSDSYYVKQPAAGEATDESKKLINQYEYAGLLNREYFTASAEDDGYFDDANASDTTKYIVNKLKAATGKSTATEVWNTMFGTEFGYGISLTQPLLIWNDASMTNAYGFIGNSTTISANNYKAISLRVKVGALSGVDTSDLAAYIYLIDMSDTTYSSSLSIDRKVSYWYDDKGNICAGDPEDSDIAFKLQKDYGLYKANKSWSQYGTLSETEKNAYFANLSAYEKDSDGNLVVAEGGAYHEYTDVWNNEGEDGIAFYYNKSNSTYYADKAKTIPVYNLADVAALESRYAAEEAQTMMQKVTYTGDEWATVTFYIHTGDEAKNYRLEVWSGERNGAANVADSYVVFDLNSRDGQTGFDTLLPIYEKDTDNVTASFKNAFSYYDSAKYLRYAKEFDENEVGNTYAYTPSDYEEGTAYLRYENGNNYAVFADYSYSEINVTKTVEPEEDDTTTDGSTSTEEEDTTASGDFWMLFSSIALAVVLLLTIVSIFVRKAVKNARKAHSKKSRASKIKKEKSAKAKKSEKVKPEDEDSPYND